MEIYNRSMSMAQLRSIYNATGSSKVIDYVFKTYGFKGLINLDLSLAIGTVSNLLANETEVMLFEARNLSGIEYDTFLKLVFEVASNINDEWDDRCDNILRLISDINLSHDGIRERNASRGFIISMLSFAEESMRAGNESETSIFSPDDIIGALIENPSLLEDDLFDWLRNNPKVARHFIINYRRIYEERNSDIPSDYNYIFNDNMLNFGKILSLFIRYRDILTEYFEQTTTEGNVLNEMVDTMYDLICEIDASDTISVSRNIISRTAMGDLFVESSQFLLAQESSNTEITKLFWSVWLKYNYSTIEELHEEVTEIHSRDDYYSLMNEWASEVNNATNAGLLYGLYFNDTYKDDPLLALEVNYVCNDQRYIDALDKLIEVGVLPPEFRCTEEYVNEILPTLYPEVSLFQNKGITQKNIELPVDADVDAILNSLY